MFNDGHELGRLSPQEIAAATVNAIVYREYLDPDYTVPNTAKVVEADVNEPPWNRRVPGAVLWADPGERLYVHVLNGDPDACHSFHVHGVKYGIDSDGAWPFGVRAPDGSRSDEIRPGERWTYVFDATKETIGAWAFHDHAHNVAQVVNRGLFGGLIVRDPSAAYVDHEVPIFVHQMVGTGIECSFLSDTLTPGDTFQVTFGVQEGTCRYHCAIHGPTMWGEVQVMAGAAPPPVIRAVDNQWKPQVVQVPLGAQVTWQNDETEANRNHIVVSDGGGASTFCLNGRAFVGNTPTVVAETGERLRWYLLNLDLGGVWHNFHPHSARWRLPTPPGGATDVHSLSPVESFISETTVPPAVRLPCELEELQCDPPADACRVRVKGDFLFHCHIEEHMMRGLAGLVRAREWVWLTEEAARALPLTLPLDDDANECPVVDLDRCRPKGSHRKGDDKTHRHTSVQHQPSPHVAPMPTPPMGPMSGMGGLTAPPVDLSEASTRGIWELLPCDSQVLAVHAALMHTGKVLFFAGSGNDEQYTTGLRSVVWDYENGSFHQPFTPTDFFCAGQSFLADGRLLVAGGTLDYAFTGLPDAYLFDPSVEEWIRVQDMAEGRWYPTLLTLGDGRILTTSGGPNRDEIYSHLAGWTRQPAGQGWPLFPHLFLLKDGRVFYSGGHEGGSGGLNPGILDLANPAAGLTNVGLPGTFDVDHRGEAASVLLPPAQDQRVLILGGGDPAIKSACLIDLSAANPAYVATAELHEARMHVNAVILPDRTVVAVGGSAKGEDPTVAALHAEIYNPATRNWILGAKATVPRLYHSVALLLADGRVITAGSNPHRRDDELRLELYHPPYLFKGSRPFFESPPEDISYGETIELHTAQARFIRWAQLIRPMATTHSVDTEQRLVDLPIAERTFCRLRVRVPREPNIAPPGWYMLFITDEDGVPSRAAWVNLLAKGAERVDLEATLERARMRGAERRVARRRLPVKAKGLRIKREAEE